MRPSKPLLVAVVLLPLAACGQREPAPAPAPPPAATAPAPAAQPASGRERAEAIRVAADRYQKVEGRHARGDADTAYVAYFDGGELRLIEASTAMGDYGKREARYWFEGGQLFYHTGEMPSQSMAGGGREGLVPNVPVVAEFGPGGEVVRAIRIEHAGETKLDDVAVAGIRNVATALSQAATDEWSAAQAR